MLTVFHFFQAIAFYGFGNWLPTLVNAQNHNMPRSAEVSFFSTLAFPVGRLLWSVIAETYERKWHIVAAAVGTAIFGLLFATRTGPLGVAVLGILITPMTSLLGFSSRAYQAELFPTRLRARAVGFVYSWGRLSTAFTSLISWISLPTFWNTSSLCFDLLRYVRGRRVCRSLRAAPSRPDSRADFCLASG